MSPIAPLPKRVLHWTGFLIYNSAWRVPSPVGLGIRRFGWRGRGEERGVRSSIGSMLGGFVFGKSSKHKSDNFKAVARKMG